MNQGHNRVLNGVILAQLFNISFVIVILCFVSKIDAFDYDEQAGSVSNRRTAVKIDPSHGVSLSWNVRDENIFLKFLILTVALLLLQKRKKLLFLC